MQKTDYCARSAASAGTMGIFLGQKYYIIDDLNTKISMVRL